MTATDDSHISAERIVKAKARFEALLGEAAVLSGPGPVEEFRDPFRGPQATAHTPSLVVQPGTVEEVVSVLAVARELSIPLWTSSMGRNFGYGGSAPVVNGSVVLNLRRMNRILDIDAGSGFALLEPGVTFHQLYDELRRQDLPLMMSVPDLGWGSMIGNALDHGLGYGVLGDHASSLCGLEVVLPTGEVIRTGQGAIPGGRLSSCHKRGYGPSLDDLFKQSNFGIVTKAGYWLAPRPQKILTGTIVCDGERDLAALIDSTVPLLRDGTIQGVPMIVGNPPEVEQGHGNFTVSQLKSVLRPGRWSMRIGIYGSSPLIEARREVIAGAIAGIDGARLDLREYAGTDGPDEVEPRDYIAAGIPNMVLLDRLRAAFGETVGHIDFSPVLPAEGKAALEAEEMVQAVMRKYQLVGAFGVLLSARSMIAPCMVFFDATDQSRVDTAHKAFREMHERINSLGYGIYRSHISVADEVAASYGFGEGALSRLYTRLKDALDPDGILSPGNHGIWPSGRG